MTRITLALCQVVLHMTRFILVLEAQSAHRSVLVRIPGAAKEAAETRAVIAASVVAHRRGPFRQARRVPIRPA